MSDEITFSLVVTKKTPGELLTNIEALETLVTQKLEAYTPELYAGDADAAKKDRALLNTSKQTLSRARIDLMRELARPYEEFEARCKKLEGNIDAASKALDVIVKAKEDAEKEARKLEIESYWKTKEFDLIKLSQIFDQKWLNKTAKMKEIKAEIDARIESVYAGIKTIEAFGVDVETLKPLFLESLDIGKTIEQGNRIKENRARLEKEESERAAREADAERRTAIVELTREEVKAQDSAPLENMAAAALEVEPDNDPETSYTLRFYGRRSVLFALRKYMIDNGIKYEKIEG